MGELDKARQWHQQGDLERAIAGYRNALLATPGDVRAWHDYAVALLQSRRTPEAITVLQQALTLTPGHHDLLLALAQAHQSCGQPDEALACAGAATVSQPGSPFAWLLQGRLESASGAGIEAEASLRRALALMPELDEAWHYLGEALQQQRRWDDAAQAYRNAMRSQPGEIMNIGICAELAGRWEEARDAFRRMCELHPHRRDCLARLAQAEAMLCDFESGTESGTHLARLLEQGPAASSDDCAEPFALSYQPIPDAARRDAMRHYARRIQARAPTALPSRAITRGGRLRIGYIGADFGQHAVGLLLRGLFAAHDRSRLQVFGYSLKRHDDPIAEALRTEFDVFHDLEGVSAAAIATCIDKDRIDVLIDLSGYTGGARPEVLAMRPAPLQLGWLGFIHGHEAPWLDGLVLDALIQPEDADWPYSDTVLRLPGLLFPCGPMPSGTPDRARFGLPADVPLLASFNNSYKLDAELVEAWIEILRRTGDAHLAVYLPTEARPHFLHAWERHGGDPSRLHPVGYLPTGEQADRAASCDLFLDAFRYQAGATALASVAAGLPLLSRVGTSPLARLGAGLNRFLGMHELVCTDTSQYIDRAVELAGDRGRLVALRVHMLRAAEDMQLFNPRRGAAAIESMVDSLLEARNPAHAALRP